MERKSLKIENTDVTLFCSDKADSPLVLFNSFNSNGDEIVELLSKMEVPSFNFLNIRVDD